MTKTSSGISNSEKILLTVGVFLFAGTMFYMFLANLQQKYEEDKKKR
jgi:uncharacterized membrane protein YgdD (TMEM256/DUF423 family)